MIFLDCPYSEKDECKSLGGRWDNDVKKWYVHGTRTLVFGLLKFPASKFQ